jgi:hypothetical protein
VSNDDLEIESVSDELPEPDREYYVDKIDLAELRRYVCLDLARMCLAAPDKTVKIAREMETFLKGNGVRGAVE